MKIDYDKRKELLEIRQEYSKDKILKHLKDANKDQKDYTQSTYKELKELDDYVKDRFREITGVELKDDFSILKMFSHLTSSSYKEINKIEDEITNQMQNQFGKTISYDDLMVGIPMKEMDQKDKEFINGKIQKKGFAYEVGENEMAVTCSGAVFTYGNKKLPPSSLIFNMNSAKYCPSTECALRKICYATGVNNRFKETMYRDLRNKVMLQTINDNKMSARLFLKLIKTYIEQSKVRILNIRLSEAGDFINQEQIIAAEKFAKFVYQHYNIKTTVYTSRAFDFSQCEYLIVNASNFKVKGADRYYFCRDEQWMNRNGIDTTIDGQIKTWEKPHTGEKLKYFFCGCDCHKCNFCYNTREENGETSDKTDEKSLVRVFVLPH